MYTNMTTNLMVENVDQSLAFYRDILGFSETASVPSESGSLQFAILTKDGVNLMLQERTNLISECPTLDTPKTRPSATLYIMVDNFEQLYSELKEKCEIYSDIHTTFYGAKEFAIADNTGYILTFTEHREV